PLKENCCRKRLRLWQSSRVGSTMIADAVAIQRPRQASCKPFIEMSTRRVRNATIAISRRPPAQPLKRSPKPPRHLPSAQPLHIRLSPSLPVQFHAFHPSALCPSWHKTFCCWTFAPARPLYPAASLRDFLSGALKISDTLRGGAVALLHRALPAHATSHRQHRAYQSDSTALSQKPNVKAARSAGVRAMRSWPRDSRDDLGRSHGRDGFARRANPLRFRAASRLERCAPGLVRSHSRRPQGKPTRSTNDPRSAQFQRRSPTKSGPSPPR